MLAYFPSVTDGGHSRATHATRVILDEFRERNGQPCSSWQDIPFGESRWLTVVSRDDPGGTELLLEDACGNLIRIAEVGGPR
jgi:hypothetical protein